MDEKNVRKQHYKSSDGNRPIVAADITLVLTCTVHEPVCSADYNEANSTTADCVNARGLQEHGRLR